MNMEVHPKVNPAGNPLSIRVPDPTSPASKCNLKKHGIWAGVIALIALFDFSSLSLPEKAGIPAAVASSQRRKNQAHVERTASSVSRPK
jgi:hypothetical protein